VVHGPLGFKPRILAPPPLVNYGDDDLGNQAFSASQGKQKTPAPSKKSAQPDSKMRKVVEVASWSQPKAGSAAAISQSIKIGRLNPQEQSVQLRAAKRVESLARLTRKAHLYQFAMDRFCRRLVYHNRHFGKSIQEGKMVDLIDKSKRLSWTLLQRKSKRTVTDSASARLKSWLTKVPSWPKNPKKFWFRPQQGTYQAQLWSALHLCPWIQMWK
jgi:hypothetical protein